MDFGPAASHGFINNCFNWAGFALLIYDHLCTLPEELQFIWSRPKVVASMIFLATRYITFVGYYAIIVFMAVGGTGEQNCRHWSTFRQALLCLTQALVYVLASMRTYALWMRSRRILVLIVGAELCTIVVNVWAFLDNSHGTVTWTETAFFGCQTIVPQDLANHLVVPWETVLALDALFVILTLLGTINNRPRHECIMAGTRNLSLPSLLLRDGIVYFVLIATINQANVVLFYVGNPETKGALSSLASSVAVTMITRLTLNLHKSAPSKLASTVSGLPDSDTSKLVFTSILTHDRRGSLTGSEFNYEEWAKVQFLV